MEPSAGTAVPELQALRLGEGWCSNSVWGSVIRRMRNGNWAAKNSLCTPLLAHELFSGKAVPTDSAAVLLPRTVTGTAAMSAC